VAHHLAQFVAISHGRRHLVEHLGLTITKPQLEENRAFRYIRRPFRYSQTPKLLHQRVFPTPWWLPGRNCYISPCQIISR
jgi:hypothetical protein